MDFKTRREIYNRCNPTEALGPDDPRCVDVDDFGNESNRARGVRWVDRLADRVELSDRPAFVLFTGLPGSGKSTELKRLEKRLTDPHGAHLLVVRVDAETALDLMNPVDISDIMAVLVHESERRVLEAERRDPDEALKDGYLKRLWTWLCDTNVELKGVEFTVEEAASLTVELRTRPTLRERVRSTIAIHLSRFLKEVRDELVLLEGRARKQGYQGLVLILDSLEKLRGMSSNYEDVLASAEKLFSGGAPHLQLPVHVIYTVPAALVCRRHFPEVCFLPMLRVAAKGGLSPEPGRNAARTIVAKRVTNEQLEQQLGVDYEVRLQRLIDWSGGYPRELVRLLQSMFAIAQAPVSEQAFERVINEVKDSYRRLVNASDYEWLAEVASQKYLVGRNEEHRPLAERMLSDNAVLRYLNGEEWFDLHPAVREIPGVKEALQQRGAPPSSKPPKG